ncbi:MAG TPA: nucleotidyltransferase family protein [Kofleriaceae bacterium]
MSLGAVILAAGAGTRLGGVAKALLPTAHGGTFLGHVVETARAAGTETIVVVVGPPFGADVAAHAGTLGIGVVENPEPARGMASSIALGFAALLETTCDRAWLWPVDHPDVSLETLRALLAALGEHAAAKPIVGGRGGHPPLIARRLFELLATCAQLPHGARDVLGGADTISVDVRDAGSVRDVDTPEDLA